MRSVIVFLTLVLCWPSVSAEPLGSGFTYQGQLFQNGRAATGIFDFEYQVYDMSAGGIQIAPPILVEDLQVTNGIFEVELDFGLGPFAGDKIWLEVNVREGSSESGYFRLLPRQELTPTPFALLARFVEVGAISSQEIADNSIAAEDIAPNAIGVSQINSSQIQQRVSGGCNQGASVRSIGADGSVICQTDADTTYSAGNGLEQTGTAFSVNMETVQSRVTGRCSPGMFLAGVNADGSAFCQGLSVALTRTLDSSARVGRNSDIAIRTGNLPIISYWDSSNGDLKVYACADASCASGTSHTLDTVGIVGRYTSIALRGGDLPVISYFDDSNDDLKLYRCADVNCATGSATAIDTEGDVGRYSRVAIREDGNPIISYYDASNADLKVFDCSDTDCNAGTIRSPDTSGVTGLWTSIAIGDEGNPVISYYNASSDVLRVFACSTVNCSNGTARSLDSIGSIGSFTDVAIRSNGLPSISYYESISDNIMLYDCFTADCSAGNARILASGGSLGRSTSLAIRSDDRPIVAYHIGGGSGPFELRAYDCENSACTDGAIRSLRSADIQDYGTSIAVRPDGLPIIVYHEDALGGLLRVVSCGDENCEN